MLRKICLALIALAFLALGAGGMYWLITLRTPPPRQEAVNPGPLVRVTTVQPQDVPLTIEGFGTVRAKHTWRVTPEVSGAVVTLSPHVRAGLHVKRGEVLLEIDPRPYRLVAQRIRAQIRQHEKEIAVLRQQRHNHAATLRLAENNLAIADEELRRDEELARRGTISTRERDRRKQARNDSQQAVQLTMNSLALIGPQTEKSEAAIAVAQAELADAQLKLSKTRIVAPFAGQVVQSSLELGEFVAAGQAVATLYDTTAVEIPIAVSLDELRWLPALSPATLPHQDPTPRHDPSSLPTATAYWQSGGRDYTWQGRVVRWEAGMDTQTRTMTLVVEVRDPWQTFQPGAYPPLQPGMFCRIEIAANRIPHAVLIPRTALHEAQTVYLVQEGKLVRRTVEVLRLLRDQAILSAGLAAGDTLILSPLTAPIEGMKIRPLEAASPLLPTAATANTAAVLPKTPASPGKER